MVTVAMLDLVLLVVRLRVLREGRTIAGPGKSVERPRHVMGLLPTWVEKAKR